MPKIAKTLTEREVRALKCNVSTSGEYEGQPIHTRKPVGGVKGLYISMWPDGRRSWILRTTHNGKRANFGLGSCDTVSLSAARKEARKVYEELLDGIDRREVRKAERVARKRDKTFEQVADEYLQTSVFPRINANEKNKRQWAQTLQDYAYPIIGHLSIDAITTDQVADMLGKIWKEKTDTASKLKGRVKEVFSYANSKGYTDKANPATHDRLKPLLPAARTMRNKRNHPALQLSDAQRFWKDLRARDDLAAKALALNVLTTLRTEPTLHAAWDQFDIKKRRWTVPSVRVKGKDWNYVVPLSDEALQLLKEIPRTGDLLFPNEQGRPFHIDWMRNYLQKQMHGHSLKRGEQGYVDPSQQDSNGNPRKITPHGFRATFETWALTVSHHDQFVIDLQMNHGTGQKMHDHYLRSDGFEKRLALVNDYAGWLAERGEDSSS